MNTYKAKGRDVWAGQSIYVTVWPVTTDETRLPNETYAAMRERTQPARLAADKQAELDADLIATILNLE